MLREKTLRALILHKTVHSKRTTDCDELCERDKRVLKRERGREGFPGEGTSLGDTEPENNPAK